MAATRLSTEQLLEHANFIRNVVRGMVTDESQVEDVVQQTLITAIEAPPSGPGATRGWLKTVAQNWARKLYRGETRRKRRELDAGVKVEENLPASDQLERRRLLKSITEAVLCLEEPYQSAILLRYYEDLGPSEIAERLGLPYATVRTRLKRATRKLRARLDADYDGDRTAWIAAAGTFFAEDPPGSQVIPPTTSRDPANAISPEATSRQETSKQLLRTVLITTILGGAGGIFLVILPEADNSDPTPTSSSITPLPSESSDLPSDGEPSLRSRRTPNSPGTPRQVQEGTPPSKGPSIDRAEEEGANLVVRVVWQASGLPVPGLKGAVRPAGWLNHITDLLPIQGHNYPFETDEEGSFRVTGLREDLWAVSIGRRGATALAEVKAGRANEIEIPMLQGCTLMGTVVDRNETPVPSANLFFHASNSDPGYRITQTDSRGAFEIRGITAARSISAQAPGFSPSSLLEVRNNFRGTQTSVLRLGPPGAQLSGTVFDSNGVPTEGVSISLVHPDHLPFPFERPSGERELFPSIHHSWSQSTGDFLFEGIAPGPWQLLAFREGSAPWRAAFELPPAEHPPITVRLSNGASILGRVTTPDGAPVENAGIQVRAAEVSDPRFQLDATTDADGSYRMDLVPTGSLLAQVSSQRGTAPPSNLAASEGAEIRWDVELQPSSTLRGRVVDADGTPLKNWGVAADLRLGLRRFDPQGKMLSTMSDDEGRFQFTGCPSRPFRILFVAPHDTFVVECNMTTAKFNGVRTSLEEIEFRIPAANRPSSYFKGRILDSDGNPPGRARIFLGPQDRLFESMLVAAKPGAEFVVGPISPGNYRVSVNVGKIMGEEAWGVFNLPPDTTVDLGTFREQPPGALTLNPREVAVPWESVEFWIADEFFDALSPLLRQDGTVGTNWLYPGRYSLLVTGENVAWKTLPVEVRADQDDLVDVDIERGFPFRFEIQQTRGLPSAAADTRLFDLNGDLVYCDVLSRNRADQPFEGRWFLAPGEYTLKIETDLGLTAEGSIQISGSENDAEADRKWSFDVE